MYREGFCTFHSNKAKRCLFINEPKSLEPAFPESNEVRERFLPPTMNTIAMIMSKLRHVHQPTRQGFQYALLSRVAASSDIDSRGS